MGIARSWASFSTCLTSAVATPPRYISDLNYLYGESNADNYRKASSLRIQHKYMVSLKSSLLQLFLSFRRVHPFLNCHCCGGDGLGMNRRQFPSYSLAANAWTWKPFTASDMPVQFVVSDGCGYYRGSMWWFWLTEIPAIGILRLCTVKKKKFKFF